MDARSYCCGGMCLRSWNINADSETNGTTTLTDRFAGEVKGSLELLPNSLMIAGVGAIGRRHHTAGGHWLLLIYDFDKVDLSNVTTQGYRVDPLAGPGQSHG